MVSPMPMNVPRCQNNLIKTYQTLFGRTNGQSDKSSGRSDGRTVGQTGGRTDRRTDRRVYGVTHGSHDETRNLWLHTTRCKSCIEIQSGSNGATCAADGSSGSASGSSGAASGSASGAASGAASGSDSGAASGSSGAASGAASSRLGFAEKRALQPRLAKQLLVETHCSVASPSASVVVGFAAAAALAAARHI